MGKVVLQPGDAAQQKVFAEGRHADDTKHEEQKLDSHRHLCGKGQGRTYLPQQGEAGQAFRCGHGNPQQGDAASHADFQQPHTDIEDAQPPEKTTLPRTGKGVDLAADVRHSVVGVLFVCHLILVLLRLTQKIRFRSQASRSPWP